MIIEKTLNRTERMYGYFHWHSKDDEQIKAALKNTKLIDVKIGDTIYKSRSVDYTRRRIYLGAAKRSIDCNNISASITSEGIVITCK